MLDLRQDHGTALGCYTLGATLGVGTFGKVKLATFRKINKKVAIKVVNKATMKSMNMQSKLRREITILSKLRHPHVIRLYAVIDSPSDLFIIMEYVPGGELFDYIVQNVRLSENEARRLFQEVISGVEFCHNNMVCHRDLKPENLLLDSNLHIKICDFGLSNRLQDGYFLRSSCGSPNYASPEVVSGKSYGGQEADVWSCGVVLYALLCGCLPFDDENLPALFRKIRHGNFTLPGHLSSAAKDLLVHMLLVDPLKRISIRRTIRSPWFSRNLPVYVKAVLRNTSDDPLFLEPHILEIMKQSHMDVVSKYGTTCPETLRKEATQSETVAYQLLNDHITQLDIFSSTLPPQFRLSGNRLFSHKTLHAGFQRQTQLYRSDKPTFVSEHVSDPERRIRGTPSVFSPKNSLETGSSRQSWGTTRWRLGTEFVMDAPILIEGLFSILIDLNLEWAHQTPWRVSCRPKSPGPWHSIENPKQVPGLLIIQIYKLTMTKYSVVFIVHPRYSLNLSPVVLDITQRLHYLAYS